MLENVQVKEEEQKKAGRKEINEMGRITVEASLVAARDLEREWIKAVGRTSLEKAPDSKRKEAGKVCLEKALGKREKVCPAWNKEWIGQGSMHHGDRKTHGEDSADGEITMTIMQDGRLMGRDNSVRRS